MTLEALTLRTARARGAGVLTAAAAAVRGREFRVAVLGVVVVAACVDVLLALPVKGPHVFGDELIYWDMSRTFGAAGGLATRGTHLSYGPIYPLLISLAHVFGRQEWDAYVFARCLNGVLFSLSAVPAYAIAARILKPRVALGAAAIAALLPSIVYTSTIMTENAFYPAFLTTVWLMLRALERPNSLRQFALVAMFAVAFFVRAQAVVLVPAYFAAAAALRWLTNDDSGRARWISLMREQKTALLAVAGGGCAAAFLSTARGHSVFGSYHVLLRMPPPLQTLQWALANLADLELYVGVIPLAVFGFMLVSACRSTLRDETRRVVIVGTSVSVAMLAATTALSASRWGLGRVHERNLFYVVPLVMIVFLAWIDSPPRLPRRVLVGAAPIVALLPLSIPVHSVPKSGLDALALAVWKGLPGREATLGMAAFATAAYVVLLVAPTRRTLVAFSLAAMIPVLSLGELVAIRSVYDHRPATATLGWVDRAVGSESSVALIWPWAARPKLSTETYRLWFTEFYNRSVDKVASAGGPLPDGLPVERVRVRADGCLVPTRWGNTTYAIIDARVRVTTPAIAQDEASGLKLYRLQVGNGAPCALRLTNIRRD
jgi:hypothetical protein